MAKTYTVNLGGKDWPLSYTVDDAIELKRKFGKPLNTLLREDVLGAVERPKPDGLPGQTHWVVTGTADLEVQLGFLAVGMRNGNGQPDEKKVKGWVNEMLTAGQDFSPLAITVWKACLASGITGTVMDPDATEEPGKD